MWSLEEFISKRVTSKPSANALTLQDSDKAILESFVAMAGRVQEAVQDGSQSDALKIVSDFIRDSVSARYLASQGSRLSEGDGAAWYTMWSVGLGLLRLVAPVIPNVAEEFYQQYFRDREDSASIHSVPWPGPMASLKK